MSRTLVNARTPHGARRARGHRWRRDDDRLETIGPLTDPTSHGGTAADAFHLVLPSLPGYGFSGEPTQLGWESGRIRPRVGEADEA